MKKHATLHRVLIPSVLAAVAVIVSACGSTSAMSATSSTGSSAPASTTTTTPPPKGTTGTTPPTADDAAGASSPDTGARGPRDRREPCAPSLVDALPTGFTCRTVTVDGFAREYLAYVPPSVAASSDPSPSVLMFHGSTGTMEQFAKISGWREKADAEGFVVGFTQGLQYYVIDDGSARWSTKFNTYNLASEIDADRRLPGYPEAAPWPANDVAYTEAVLDDLATLHPLDPDRSYVSGFSNGSGMAHRLAMELDDRITAASGSGGFVGRIAPTDGTVAPMWTSVGSKDDRYLEATGLTALPLDPDEILSGPVMTIVTPALTIWGLPIEPCSVDATPTSATIRWCAPGKSDYRLTVIEGLTHSYPNGMNQRTNPSGVNMVDRFWPFMQEATSPSAER